MAGGLEVVFLDVGGVLYDDRPYAMALRTGLRELGARFTHAEFDAAYARCRDAQQGSFRRRLVTDLLAPADVDAAVRDLTRRAARYWHYLPDALFADARPALEELSGRYRLGVIANQPATVRHALSRDGLDPYFEVWVVSDEVGVEKPDPAIFRAAVDAAGAPPERCVMAGDRLDYDVRPARSVGMRTVWVLRGEAPDRPTPEQLDEPDASVRSLEELPSVLDQLNGRATRATLR